MARSTYRMEQAPPIPCASVAPGRIHWYELPAHWYAGNRGGGGGERSGRPPKIDLERSAYRSRRDCLDAAGWLWLASKGKVYRSKGGAEVFMRQAMWTLTLPDPAPETAARRALSSWLTWARNCQGLRSYLWVAELTKRGRVHFHVLVNEWIGVEAARWAWLRALHREGISLDVEAPPGAMVRVDPVVSSGEARGYVSKYIGKDFGDRSSQLVHRLTNLDAVARELTDKGTEPDAVPGVIAEFRSELRARLVDAIHKPLATRRRWGASNDLERKPIQVIGADEPRLLAAIHTEVSRMEGVRWGKQGEHGIACYFDLAIVSPDNCPALHLALHGSPN